MQSQHLKVIASLALQKADLINFQPDIFSSSLSYGVLINRSNRAHRDLENFGAKE
jgi:hypothetical protein